MNMTLKEYHAPVWSEPVILEMGYPGRRGVIFLTWKPTCKLLSAVPTA